MGVHFPRPLWAKFGAIAFKIERVASEIRNCYFRVELLADSKDDSKLLQHGLSGSGRLPGHPRPASNVKEAGTSIK